jgi:hypothetical protein
MAAIVVAVARLAAEDGAPVFVPAAPGGVPAHRFSPLQLAAGKSANPAKSFCGIKLQAHVTLSGVSGLSDAQSVNEILGLTCQRLLGRPPVFAVTSRSQPAFTRLASSFSVPSASSVFPSAFCRTSSRETSLLRFARSQRSTRRALVCCSLKPI